ncbi:uncharacterized protein [Epargyreus clarus]|uniref:uncharacterized protein n=1 Tax=Epargyreus clarus TaxID=520877 RepID=UPI003C2F2C53
MPRPRRRRQSLDSAEGTDKNLDSSYEDRLEPLLSAFARAQAQSNRELIESILNSHTLNQSSTSPTSPGMSSMVQTGNFANCTARFNGSKQDSEVVEAFVDAICVYKECTNISDDHALRGLPMLLEGEAAVWFRGVKASIASWDDALKRLRSMYGAPRPPHKIFRDIFASDQRSERAEVFVTRLRALMAKLPYTIEERIQLDMIYGLLNNIIRERVSRESVHSIEDLISKARHIEDTINEAPAYPSTVGTLRGFHVYQKKTLPSFAARGFAAPALNTSVPPPALCSAPPPTLIAAAPSPALCASVPPPPAVASVRSAGNASNAPVLTATSTSDDTTKVVRLSSSAGIDFLRKARITINMHRNTWFTADRPHVTHRLHWERSRSPMVCASADFQRAFKGTMLEPHERTILAEQRQEYEDVFKEGGGPKTENYVPQITPHLLKLAGPLIAPKGSVEYEQEKRKRVQNKARQNAEGYVPGDLVLLRGHMLSSKGFSSKLAPRQDGPYVITKKVSSTTYILSRCGSSDEILGKYHTRDLRRYHARQDDQPEPVGPKRPRCRRRNPVA